MRAPLLPVWARDLYLASDVECCPALPRRGHSHGFDGGNGDGCALWRINGIPELIRDGIEGLLFTASDVSELTSAISKLMDDRELRRRMAASSCERVTENYDLQKNVMMPIRGVQPVDVARACRFRRVFKSSDS
jgi:hypothetical protein